MRIAFIAIIIAVLAIHAAAQSQSSSTDANIITRPYCSFIFNDEEFKIQKQKNQQIVIDLKQHFNGSGTHFISSLVKYFNGQRIIFTNLISQAESQTISYFSTYLLGLLLLIGISLYWCFGICFTRKTKQLKPQRQNRQILLKIQLALAGLALSLLFVIILSIYGMNQSPKIQLGVNQFFCQFFQQPNQFLRNQTGEYNLNWYATELQRFEAIFVKNQKQLSPLIYNFELRQMILNGQTLLRKSNGQLNENKQFNEELTTAVEYLQGIHHTSETIKTNLEDFHLTVQYVREVAIGYRFVLTILEKQINKLAKVQNFSSFLSSYSHYLYLCFILVSLISMIGITGVTILQVTSKYYFKDIFFYFMGIFSFIGLLAAIFNSILVSTFLWIHDTAIYVLPSEQIFRKELTQGKFLNQMIVEVIAKFHPLSDGDYSTIYDGALAQDCGKLSHNLQYFTSNGNIAEDILKKGTSYFDQEASKHLDDMQLLTKFSNQLSSPLIAQMTAANSGLKNILLQMDQIDGALGRLDSSAFGRYIRGIADYLLIPSINNSVEHRWIFGFCGYALLLGLLFAYMINIFSLEEVRVHEGQQQKQSLSKMNNDKQLPSQQYGIEERTDQCI